MKYIRLELDEQVETYLNLRDYRESRLELRRLRTAEREKEIQAELDEANAIIIPEGSKLKWSDALGKMVWG